jgi:hypothetical protein
MKNSLDHKNDRTLAKQAVGAKAIGALATGALGLEQWRSEHSPSAGW